jgi:microcystin degradation protein MlrC
MEKARGARGPIVLADAQDNPGAGGNADTVWLIEALVRLRAQRAVVGMMFDPAAAAACHAAGEGRTVELALGAGSGQQGHTPYRASFRIEKLGNGSFTAHGPMYAGARMELGPMALLETGGVRIVVGSRKAQTADQSIFRHLGIEPAQQAIVVVKSSVHFRNDFQPIAAEVLVVAAPGPMPMDPTQLPWTKLRPGVRVAPMGKALGKPGKAAGAE